jgi:hypothetical protein
MIDDDEILREVEAEERAQQISLNQQKQAIGSVFTRMFQRGHPAAQGPLSPAGRDSPSNLRTSGRGGGYDERNTRGGGRYRDDDERSQVSQYSQYSQYSQHSQGQQAAASGWQQSRSKMKAVGAVMHSLKNPGRSRNGNAGRRHDEMPPPPEDDDQDDVAAASGWKQSRSKMKAVGATMHSLKNAGRSRNSEQMVPRRQHHEEDEDVIVEQHASGKGRWAAAAKRVSTSAGVIRQMKVNGKAPPPPVTNDDDEDLPPPSDDDGWDAPPPFEGEECAVVVLVVSVLELTQAQAMMIYRRLMTMACRLRPIL